MSRIIIVDFRDDEDFANHPYISYLKQTLNMISYLDQVPELWKLNDFFVECVSDYLEIKRERVLFSRLWDVSIDISRNVGLITNEEFLKEVAKRKKYTFISTGMSNYKMIDKAVEIFKDNKCEFELMHTVSTYPCPEDQLNLHIIQDLKNKYKCKVGYSGHEPSVSPSIVAACLGVTSIERHITLDRAMYGSDQAASLEKKGLEELVSIIRKIPMVIGNKEKNIFECEIEVAKKLRYWEK